MMLSHASRRLSSSGFSAHLIQRMAQRNLDCKDIDYIMRYGCHTHRAGAVLTVLRGKDIPHDDRADAECARLEGSVVVADPDSGCLITVYRNRQTAPRRVRRKPRHSC